MSVYDEAFEFGSLSPTLTQASISLWLKKDKDPACCSLYRPLSLLNVDIKILVKALATRQEKVLPAFERVKWLYLFEVLYKFCFGDRFISWIRLLYTLPQASVHTNNSRWDYFTLQCGTRQGWTRPLPLSHGMSHSGIELKLSLYADDCLLFVSDLLTGQLYCQFYLHWRDLALSQAIKLISLKVNVSL